MKARRHLLGAFVLFHLVAITLGATPSVRAALSRAQWRDPVVQEELGQWARRLDDVGVWVTKRQLEDFLWEVTVGWTRVRDGVVGPFEPYLRVTGSRQPWRLFTAPHRYPSRLEIAVRPRGGAFRDVYVARSDEHDWQRRRFDDVRFRKAIYMYGWSSRQKAWRQFTRWVAREAARDFPDAAEVRVRFWRYKTPSPDDVLARRLPRGHARYARVLDLEELR